MFRFLSAGSIFAVCLACSVYAQSAPTFGRDPIESQQQAVGSWRNDVDLKIDLIIYYSNSFPDLQFYVKAEGYDPRAGFARIEDKTLIIQSWFILGTATFKLRNEGPDVLKGTFHHWKVENGRVLQIVFKRMR